MVVKINFYFLYLLSTVFIFLPFFLGIDLSFKVLVVILKLFRKRSEMYMKRQKEKFLKH